MPTDAPGFHRRSIRLREHDYAQPGAYFVTIGVHQHKCVFGAINDGAMRLSHIGRIVEEEWRRTSEVRAEVELDAFVIMPNHLHGIVFISEHRKDGAGNLPPRTMRGTGHRSLSSVVSGFKAATARRARALRRLPGTPLWQRNYYEHVIRDERDLERIRHYVADNPARWSEDGYHPSKLRSASSDCR